MPADVSRIIPLRQLEQTLRYYGAYAEAIDNLCRIVTAIPCIGESEKTLEKKIYIHYYTDAAEYFIYEYDGEDTMFGTAHSSVFPEVTLCQKISLVNLRNNESMKLDLSWKVPDITIK